MGFLVIPCIMAPATAKNPPTKAAASALGILTSLIILVFISASFVKIAFIIIEKSISFAPIDIDRMIPLSKSNKPININP